MLQNIGMWIDAVSCTVQITKNYNNDSTEIFNTKLKNIFHLE